MGSEEEKVEKSWITKEWDERGKGEREGWIYGETRRRGGVVDAIGEK